MGNAANFFSRDERGRRSEYISLMPAKIVNGVKGHLIKKAGDSDIQAFLFIQILPIYISGRMNMVCAKPECIFGRKCSSILTGVTPIQIKGMAESLKEELYMYRFGNKTKMELSLELMMPEV